MYMYTCLDERERERWFKKRKMYACWLFVFFMVGTRRVRANEVYQEYIKDKNHYHMNATRVITKDLIL